MANDRFAHLHLHTEFSMLDGAARVNDVVETAAAAGQPAVAITDHGVMYGVIDFYQAARRAGVTPIVGIEAYVTPGSRFARPSRAENVRHHMILLAENDIGYRNLMKLSSLAYLDGYYYKPRMDFELLSEHSEGIIATSGCLSGPVAHYLAPDTGREEGTGATARDFDTALENAGRLQDIFGRDRFFVEIQDHGLEAQQRILPDLLEIAERTGAPLLATNDAHYTHQSEADAHDVLLCIQTGATRDEPNRFKFDAEEFYLKSADQMRRLFPQDRFPGACDNTLLIAERARVDLEFGKILLPAFPVPAGETEVSYLERLVRDGARKRYAEPLPDAVEGRINHELKIIVEMGFPAYFLIVWDLIRHAHEQGIRTGPGRGSAAGSIVAYCLGITDLDPIEYDLIFERFLNPGRKQMPDIDMDFDERYRADVIRYAAEKYGSDHVAQIVTFSTIKGKQAIRDAARVYGYPYSLGDRVAKMMPPAILGREATLGQCLDAPSEGAEAHERDWHSNAAELRQAYTSDPDVKKVLDAARGLEGLRRQDSIHAAAVVIAPRPITDIVPVQRKGEGAEIVTQYEMQGVEALGLLKMDFLGLRNLATIERALELIERSTGQRPDIDSVDLGDELTFRLLQDAETVGVFQLEGSAMRALIRSLKPESFEHIIAVNALYRPGPMGMNMHHEYADRKNARKPVTYPHPATTPFLKATYGIIVYQEQVMQVARELAGYTMADADNLRKAMGKKIPAVMEAERERFVAGCVAEGHPEKLGRDLWDAIEPFAGYGFNKSHSACYAYVAFQTAFLKAHHPAEYMAALLTSTKRDKDRTALYLNECRTMGVPVLVPDINESEMDFVVHDGAIRFGLSAVRNVGEGVVEKILTSRQGDGRFADFYDFVERVDLDVLNRRTVESLIKAGAFDGIGHSRKGLLLSFEQIVDAVSERRRNEEAGQYSLFGGGDSEIAESRPDIPDLEWESKIKLAFEKEMLGLYISDHPLLSVGPALRSQASVTVSGLWDLTDGTHVTIAGLVGSITRRYTRDGKPMVFFQLEDLEGGVEVLCFPNTVERMAPVSEDVIVVVTGALDHRGDDVKIRARDVQELVVRDDETVRLEVPAARLTPDLVHRLKQVLSHHPGTAPVLLRMMGDSGHKVVRLSDDHRVEPRSALYAELRELLGAKAIL